MGDINRDVLPIDLAMGLARAVPGLGYRATPRIAPVDSNDAAPGLDYPPRAGLTVAVSIDPWGHVVHELREDDCPISDTLLWSEIPAAIDRARTGGLSVYSDPRYDVVMAWCAWLDCDHARPSPSDDITRAAWAGSGGASPLQ